MRDYRYRRRTTAEPTFAMLATVCAVGAACWWLLIRGAVLVARWVGWV
jgi:hypothetical protein